MSQKHRLIRLIIVPCLFAFTNPSSAASIGASVFPQSHSPIIITLDNIGLLVRNMAFGQSIPCVRWMRRPCLTLCMITPNTLASCASSRIGTLSISSFANAEPPQAKGKRRTLQPLAKRRPKNLEELLPMRPSAGIRDSSMRAYSILIAEAFSRPTCSYQPYHKRAPEQSKCIQIEFISDRMKMCSSSYTPQHESCDPCPTS